MVKSQSLRNKIPKFKTVKEKIEFWDTHSLADYIDDTEEVNIKIVDKRPYKKRNTIYLTKTEHEIVRKLAFFQRISMAKVIRQAVQEKLKRHKLSAGNI